MQFTEKRGTTDWPNPQAAAIERAAIHMGLSCKCTCAQTGTIYLMIDDPDYEECDKEAIVRVADHGECYCSEGISCDPDGGANVRNTIEWLAERFARPIPIATLRGWKGAETRRCNEMLRREKRIETAKVLCHKLLENEPDVAFNEDGWPLVPQLNGIENRKQRRAVAQLKIIKALDDAHNEAKRTQGNTQEARL